MLVYRELPKKKKNKTSKLQTTKKEQVIVKSMTVHMVKC